MTTDRDVVAVTRRTFLAGAGALGVGVAAGCSSGGDSAGPSTTTTPTPSAPATTTPRPEAPPTTVGEAVDDPVTEPAGPGPVVIVVEMNGGNDALNTLVPTDGRYRDARPDLAVAESDVLAVPGLDGYGLHPSLAPLVPWFERGMVAAVAGVGFEGSTRSHFQSLDWWWAGRPESPVATGWMGRWLDLTGSPGDADPLRSVGIGGGVRPLRGERSTPTRLGAGGRLRLRPPEGSRAAVVADAFVAAAEGARADADPWVAAHGAAHLRAAETVARLDELLAESDDDTEAEGESAPGRYGRSLQTAAKLVLREPALDAVVVSGGGFDTHAEQADTHAGLLADVAGGIAGFLAEIEAAGQLDRVVLMTTSEFGRRVAQNGSAGTDHGAAGLAFVAGSAVDGGLVGRLDLGDLVDGDLRPGIDVRSLYAEVLGWVDGPVTEVLGGAFEPLGILGASA